MLNLMFLLMHFQIKKKFLFQCYNYGLNVFTQSISGLEFAISEIEEKIIDTYLYKNEEDLEELHAEIKEIIQNERLSDSSEALF